MGGPAEALFRSERRLLEGFWFGTALMVFIFFFAVLMHTLIRFGRWERGRNQGDDVCYKV